MNRSISGIPVLVFLCGVVAVGACGIEEFSTTRVPDDSHLALRFSCPKDSARTSTDCVVSGLVTLNTGESAGPGWTVDLLVDKGTFVPVSGDSVIHARRLVTGAVGEVSAHYQTPSEPADVTFTLAGHGITRVETLKVVDRDAGDDPAVAAIVLMPSAISLKKGDSVQVVATFADAGKKVLAGRLAYFSVENTAKATIVGVLPADKVWLKALDTGTTSLRASRRAILAIVPLVVSP